MKSIPGILPNIMMLPRCWTYRAYWRRYQWPLRNGKRIHFVIIIHMKIQANETQNSGTFKVVDDVNDGEEEG